MSTKQPTPQGSATPATPSPKQENYIQCPSCPTLPLSEPVSETSTTITGCPNCSSIKYAFTDRTILDQKMNQFYVTSVLPQVNYDLLTMKFAY
jgi:hypothetical protein